MRDYGYSVEELANELVDSPARIHAWRGGELVIPRVVELSLLKRDVDGELIAAA